MRKYWIVGAVVAASLGLSACGSSPATINSTVSSLTSSPDVEVNLSASASGPGTAAAQKYLSAISVEATLVNPSGGNLSQATSLDTEVVVNVGTSALLDLRTVGGNIYGEIDLTALQGISGLSISSNELNAANALLGGRWFELTKSLLNSYLKSESTKLRQQGVTPPPAAKEVQDANAIETALTKFVETTPSTTLSSGGFSETASLEAFVQAMWPTLESLEPSIAAEPTNVKGSYTLTLTTSGTTATGGSVSITAPSAAGNVTVGLQATVTHNGATVVAPTNPTVLTKSVIQGLLSDALGSAIPTVSTS
ncbi:MAG: hypothetical protein ACRDVC_06935 [Acidimicrobiales bacterium]